MTDSDQLKPCLSDVHQLVLQGKLDQAKSLVELQLSSTQPGSIRTLYEKKLAEIAYLSSHSLQLNFNEKSSFDSLSQIINDLK